LNEIRLPACSLIAYPAFTYHWIQLRTKQMDFVRPTVIRAYYLREDRSLLEVELVVGDLAQQDRPCNAPSKLGEGLDMSDSNIFSGKTWKKSNARI